MNALEYTVARQSELKPRIEELGKADTLTDGIVAQHPKRFTS